MRKASTALVLCVALLSSCSSGPRSTTSGIDGLVQIGPTCPVQRADEPCPDKPFATRIRVVADGRLVTTVTSGADGRFHVTLDPGRYTLEPEAKPGPPSAGPVDVTVKADTFEQVTITFDSGIR